MAASIYGSQSLSTTQSLAAYLQALQTKNNNPASQGSNAVTGGAATGTTATGAAGSSGTDPADQITGQPLDVVTLSAQAQQLLANAQAPSVGPGSLATYLNTNNLASADASPLGDLGAIAQFRQWLSQPLGQPVPYPGDQSFSDASKTSTATGDQKSAADTKSTETKSTSETSS
jgi:hypothetical protein